MNSGRHCLGIHARHCAAAGNGLQIRYPARSRLTVSRLPRIEGQIPSASCRRAAIHWNLIQKPDGPEIRLSRSLLQPFSGASEGFRCTQPLAACTGRISASSAIHRERFGHFTGFPGPFTRSRQPRCASGTDLPAIDLHQWNRRPLSDGDHFSALAFTSRRKSRTFHNQACCPSV